MVIIIAMAITAEGRHIRPCPRMNCLIDNCYSYRLLCSPRDPHGCYTKRDPFTSVQSGLSNFQAASELHQQGPQIPPPQAVLHTHGWVPPPTIAVHKRRNSSIPHKAGCSPTLPTTQPGTSSGAPCGPPSMALHHSGLRCRLTSTVACTALPWPMGLSQAEARGRTGSPKTKATGAVAGGCM